MEPDFSGYATKNGLKCSDGRTILGGAFKHHDQTKVPLVWQHQRQDLTQVIGHAKLEHREDGTYAYCFLNSSPQGKHAKIAVEHGDVEAMSIFAHNLTQKGKNVVHGQIAEVSLVMAGANPGALIDNINLVHGDDVQVLDDEAIIYTGLELSLEHAEESGDNVADNDNTPKTETPKTDDKSLQSIIDGMSEEEQRALSFLVAQALEQNSADDTEGDDSDGDDADAEHSVNKTIINATVDPDVLQHAIQEGFTNMSRNVFDQSNAAPEKNTLSHDQLEEIVATAHKVGSFKDAFLQHAETYGFQDVETLFPDAKLIGNSPEILGRRTEWVSEVITKTKHSPFARIRTVVADITADEARARGYVKGNLKKEEIIKLLKRKTEPTTIYKKQKLDRDDIVDITDLDVVAWLKAEMRLMVDEELARAILLGDGRSGESDDKIDEDRIRPIAKDDPMYAHPVTLPSNASLEDTVDALIRARSNYRGTGQPVFFTTLPFVTDMLLHKDKVGRRVYDLVDSLANALMVSKIVPVEVMEQETEVVGIFVNLSDYTIGADKGGNVSMFDDFDIDYNQYKYLMETRVSGALTKPKSAVVVKRAEGTSAVPSSPSFNGDTNTITIPSVTGIEYTIEGIPVEDDEVISSDTDVEARAEEGYYIPSGSTTHWNFVYNAG